MSKVSSSRVLPQGLAAKSKIFRVLALALDHPNARSLGKTSAEITISK